MDRTSAGTYSYSLASAEAAVTKIEATSHRSTHSTTHTTQKHYLHHHRTSYLLPPISYPLHLIILPRRRLRAVGVALADLAFGIILKPLLASLALLFLFLTILLPLRQIGLITLKELAALCRLPFIRTTSILLTEIPLLVIIRSFPMRTLQI